MTTFAELGFKIDSRPMDKASKSLDNMTRRSGAAERAAVQLNAAKARLRRTALLAAAALTGAAAAITMITRSSLAEIDSQAKLARQLDGTIVGLTGLQRAAADAGIEFGAMSTAAEMLNTRIGEAMRNGASQSAQAFDRLGLSAEQLGKMDVDERFAALSDAMQGLPAAAISDELRQLGIRQREVTLLMQGGGDAIRDATVEMQQYGLALSEVDAAQVERANDQLDRLGLITKGMGQQLAVALAGPLETVASEINKMARESDGFKESIEDAARAGILGLASLLRAAAGLVDFFTRYSEAGQFGILGLMIFGPKGAVIGTAIGSVFGIIREQLESLGIGIDPVEHGINQMLEITQKIGDKQRDINRLRMDMKNEIQDSLGEARNTVREFDIRQLEADIRSLDEQHSELNATLKDGGENQDAFNAIMAESAEGANTAGDAIANLADILESAAAQVGNASEESNLVSLAVGDPSDIADVADEIQAETKNLLTGQLVAYYDYYDARVAAAEVASDKEAEAMQAAMTEVGRSIGEALGQGIATGDFSRLRQTLSKTVGDVFGDSITTGLTTAFAGLGAMAGPLGALGGSLIGELVSGFLGGGSRSVEDLLDLSISGGSASGFDVTRITREGIFGNRVSEFESAIASSTLLQIERSFGAASQTINQSASHLGLESQTDSFAFQMKESGATMGDFIEGASDAYAKAVFSAVERYANAGEDLSDAIVRLGSEAEEVTAALARTGVEVIGQSYIDILASGIKSANSAAIDQASKDLIDLERERDAILSARQETGSMGVGAWARLREVRKEIEDAQEAFDQIMSEAGSSVTEAIVQVNEAVLKSVADVQGVGIAQAAGELTRLTENYQKAVMSEEEILNSRIESLSARLTEIDVAGVNANTTLAEFREIFENTVTPETVAQLLAAGDALSQISDAGDRLLEMSEADRLASEAESAKILAREAESARLLAREADRLASRLLDIARSSTDAALMRLQDAVLAERDKITEAYLDEKDAIRETAELRISANQMALSAAEDGLRDMQDVVSSVRTSLSMLRGQNSPGIGPGRQSALGDLRSALSSGDLSGAGDAAQIAAQIESAEFKTREDFLREQGRTIALLDAIDKEGENQLSAAEQAIERLNLVIESIQQASEEQLSEAEKAHKSEMNRLDSIIDRARQQIDIMRGIDSGVMSVQGAINHLASAVNREREAAAHMADRSSDRLAAELQGLRQDVQSGNRVIAKNTQETTKILKREEFEREVSA